jgi:hypothetical protein
MKALMKTLLFAKMAENGMLRTIMDNDQFNYMYAQDPTGMTEACKELVETEKEDCPDCAAKAACNMYAVAHGTYGTPAHKQITSKSIKALIDKVVDKFYEKAIEEGKDPFEAFAEIEHELDVEQMIADLNITVEE